LRQLRLPRPCIRCGQLTRNTTSRCDQCPNVRADRPSSTARGYGADYRRARRQLLENNPSCWWCGRPATTADHDPPLSSARSPAEWIGRLVPACARCNYGRRGRSSSNDSRSW